MTENSNLTIGTVYRQKPNAQTKDLPDVVILFGVEPGEEYWRHIEFISFVEDKIHWSSRGSFLDRYFQITEDWHLGGL